jgi:MFS family permease
MSSDSGRWRLNGMMALIYTTQGAWWPLLAVHLQDLGLSGRARGWMFATYALASLATPLGIGQLADRRIPTQRLLGWTYATSALVLAWLATGTVRNPVVLFGIFLVYWLITAPGYGLAASLAFRNLDRPAQQYARVRLWGTIGWMLVGWTLTLIQATGLIGPGTSIGTLAFGTGALISVVFAVYSFRVLPHTPPLDGASSRRRLDLTELVDLCRRRDVSVFLAVALSVSLTMPFVYQTMPPYLQKAGLPRPWISTAMTLSQVLEIFGLAALPWLHRRFSLRGSLALGIGAWAVEYLVMSLQPPLILALIVLPLNGVAIAGFSVSGQMYLDLQAPAHRRASTQAIWIVLVTGLGSLLGSLLAGELLVRAGGVGSLVFQVPALINLGALIALVSFFRPGSAATPSPTPTAQTPATASLALGKLAPAPAGRD